MANKKYNQEKIRIEKEKRFKALCKNLVWFPVAAIGGLAVVLLLYFVNFAYVYNTTAGVGTEVAINGWACLAAMLTGNFSGTASIYGDMAVPFYYYAADWCTLLGAFSLVTFFLIIINVILQIVTIITKKHALNAAAIALDILIAILLIVCFAVALSMKDAKILSTYCANNPACSIRSLAIIPAIVSLGIAAVHIVCTVKYFSAKSLLA